MAHQSELIADNIEEYLHQHENKELLRFITCGSVDDGKSTLIGRLLYDSKMIFEDQLLAIEKDSRKSGTQGEKIDLALLVDGLQSEREQGITIDVAYRFFSTDKRKFIIADTPGHEQYTRNMATGASTADLSVILIDARHGVQVQTKRHSFIVNLLGIKNIVVAVNKMDLVDFSQERYEEIKEDYLLFFKELTADEKQPDIYFIPLSALNGDNVVTKSESTPWYKGKTLMELLDTIELATKNQLLSCGFRFPVQYVNRPNLNFRGFCGTIASGSVNVGDEITVLPSKKTTKIKEIIPPSIDKKQETLKSAFAPMSITLTTEDEIDISRGDMIVKSSEIPEVSGELDAMVVWMNEKRMDSSCEYLIKRATSVIPGRFKEIYHRIDVNTLEKREADSLEVNEIGLCRLLLTREIALDSYKTNKGTGSFIIIDRITNATVGAGMIVAAAAKKGDSFASEAPKEYTKAEVELNAYVRRHFPEWNCKKI